MVELPRVAVIGAGSWGTTVAHICATNAPTTLWCRQADVAAEIDRERTNAGYLPGFRLSPALRATSDLEQALDGGRGGRHGRALARLPVRARARRPVAPPGVPVVSLTKGVEQGTHARMTQVIAEVAPGHPAGVLSGPNLAREVMAGHPAGAVLALTDDELALRLQPVFNRPTFRVYVNTDVTGAEVAGALKNVLAIAAGMVDGLGFGDNTKATLITRGLNEIARLGTRLGGKVLTFGGLAGLGDLIATCMSPLSRNRTVGEHIGRGRSLQDVIGEMRMVAEGVKSARPVWEQSVELGLDLPIVEQVMRVTHEGATATDALAALLQRPATMELQW